MSEANLKPYLKVLNTPVSDNEGGWILDRNNTTVIYLNVTVQDNEVSAVARVESTVTVNDVIIVKDAAYRVQGIHLNDEGMFKTLDFERVDKPEVPA